MRIAYVTLDAVNGNLATITAEEWSIALQVLEPWDFRPDDPVDGVIYDLDFLPPENRQEILAALIEKGPSRPTAVHSYNLKRAQVVALRRRGVVVSRRLLPSLIGALSRKASRTRATVKTSMR